MPRCQPVPAGLGRTWQGRAGREGGLSRREALGVYPSYARMWSQCWMRGGFSGLRRWWHGGGVGPWAGRATRRSIRNVLGDAPDDSGASGGGLSGARWAPAVGSAAIPLGPAELVAAGSVLLVSGGVVLVRCHLCAGPDVGTSPYPAGPGALVRDGPVALGDLRRPHWGHHDQHAHEWDGARYAYWHLARPVLGLVTGSVAVLILLFVLRAMSGGGAGAVAVDPTKPYDGAAQAFMFVVAFVVGYRPRPPRTILGRSRPLTSPLKPRRGPRKGSRRNRRLCRRRIDRSRHLPRLTLRVNPGRPFR